MAVKMLTIEQARQKFKDEVDKYFDELSGPETRQYDLEWLDTDFAEWIGLEREKEGEL